MELKEIVAAFPREIMNIGEAADYLRVTPDTVYNYASSGLIPAFKLGNRWRFKRSILDQWTDQMSKASADVTIPSQPRKEAR